MGFFSWQCKRCDHPLLSPMATNKTNAWMSDVVGIKSNGSVIRGTYDGYGNADGIAIWSDDEPWDPDKNDPTAYHAACWENAGRPIEWAGASRQAPDQGWFFDDGEHDMPEPTLAEQEREKKESKRRARINRENSEILTPSLKAFLAGMDHRT